VYHKWIKKNKPLPPPHILKQRIIKETAERYELSTLIETGTFMGEMIYAQRLNFNRIISIELQSNFFENAQRRFRKFQNIEIILGDSGDVLKELIKRKELEQPCLFWLDGHYSTGITARGNKETPIMEELDSIFSLKIRHIILIDDARCFTGHNDYPTMEQLEKHVKKKSPLAKIINEYDIIRIEY